MSLKKKNILTKEEAKSIFIHSQGLDLKNSFGLGKKGTLNCICHLGYVQLDTLAVVARAHHHILNSRTDSHEERFLNELMREKKIFEYWSHAAAFLPMRDFRFSLIRKNEFLNGKAHWFAKDKKIHKYVLDKIKTEGPLQSKDFETDSKRGSWWDWKPTKIALEQLFQNGMLMVSERKGFQKVYDLTENILPRGIDTSPPTKEEYADYLIRSAIRASGIASLKDMTHLRSGIGPTVAKVLKKLLDDGEISEVTISSVDEKYYQLPTQNLKSEIGVSAIIISPFDNLIIRRERLKTIFDYDFVLECYLPEHKRKFGYFCLPVLYQNKFVAKFDPKADRSTGIFYIKKFHLEDSKINLEEFLPQFAKSLKAFSAFNNCTKIVVEKTYPSKLKTILTQFLKSI